LLSGFEGWQVRPHRGRIHGRNLFSTCLLLGGAAFLFKQAAAENAAGAAWAGDVCSTSQLFCHHPEYLAYAAGIMLVLAIIAKLISAVS
jgi:hypothetical protein